MKSTLILSVLVSLNGSGAFAGPCKPVSSQATQVTSVATEESTAIDVSTSLVASETISESLIAPTAESSTAQLSHSTILASTQTTEESSTAGDTTVEVTATELQTTVTEVTTTTDVSTTALDTTTAETTTAEATTTTANAPQCPTPVVCGNLGFDWAYYTSTLGPFAPENFKRIRPDYDDTTRKIGGNFIGLDDEVLIYDSFPLYQNYFVLNHRTFLYTCDEGIYKFEITNAQEAAYLWIGGTAYSGWKQENADSTAVSSGANVEINLPGGQYIPLRLFFAQAYAPGGFSFKVTAPNGQVLVGGDVEDSPYVVRYSCDGVLAPVYRDFGTEI